MPNSSLKREYLLFLKQNGRKPYRPNLNLEAIERLDLERKTASGAEGFEEDYEQEVWDSVSEYKRSRRMTFESTIEQLANEIEECVEPCFGVARPSNIYAGEYPTGSFNAMACPVNGGSLVLVNTGAIVVISKMIRLMVINIFEHLVKDKETLLSAGSSPRRVQFRSGSAALTVPQIIENIARCIFGYVASDNALDLPNLPILGGLQRVSWFLMTSATERFVVAHEYGHLVAGHLTSRSRFNARSVGGLSVYLKAQQAEFEADLNGARLVLFHARNPLEKSVQAPNVDELIPSYEYYAVAGTRIFFGLDSIITRVAASLFPESSEVIWVDHPPAKVREEKLLEFFKTEGAKVAVDSTDDLARWLHDVGHWTSMLAEGIAGSERNPARRMTIFSQLLPHFSSGLGR